MCYSYLISFFIRLISSYLRAFCLWKVFWSPFFVFSDFCAVFFLRSAVFNVLVQLLRVFVVYLSSSHPFCVFVFSSSSASRLFVFFLLDFTSFRLQVFSAFRLFVLRYRVSVFPRIFVFVTVYFYFFHGFSSWFFVFSRIFVVVTVFFRLFTDFRRRL